jgi:hypothetical protein
MISYNPRNWYWAVLGRSTQVFSSATGGYVDLTDATFKAWLDGGGHATLIDGEASLIAVLAEAAPDIVVHTPAGLAAYAATARYAKENAGIVFNGIPIATDDRSKQMLMGARIAATADPAFKANWAGSDGNVYSLTADQIIAVSNAVLAHVNSCFDKFAAVKAAIAADTVQSKAAVDALFA